MKERPILFSAPMVRALLAGTKTQTRRIFKVPPGCSWYDGMGGEREGWLQHDSGPAWWSVEESRRPYHAGDRLWVREAFDLSAGWGADEPQACEIVYWATGSTEPRAAPLGYNPMIYAREKVRPSIHMPRFASRITLEVTGVRVERLQGISSGDAIAEGVNIHEDHHSKPRDNIYGPAQAYRDLWESINGPNSWDVNPWVWVIEFKRIEP